MSEALQAPHPEMKVDQASIQSEIQKVVDFMTGKRSHRDFWAGFGRIPLTEALEKVEAYVAQAQTSFTEAPSDAKRAELIHLLAFQRNVTHHLAARKVLKAASMRAHTRQHFVHGALREQLKIGAE